MPNRILHPQTIRHLKQTAPCPLRIGGLAFIRHMGDQGGGDADISTNNDATSLKILFASGTSIEFDAAALDGKSEQMGGDDIAISIKDAADSALNTRQRQAVGSRPALDIHITSGGRRISDFGGEMRIQTPYTLRPGERAEGIVVFYVDDNGSREPCETNFDSQANIVSWVTSHNSVYMIDYVENQPITVLPPKTGEAPGIAGFLMLILGLLWCGAMAIRRRSDG